MSFSYYSLVFHNDLMILGCYYNIMKKDATVNIMKQDVTVHIMKQDAAVP